MANLNEIISDTQDNLIDVLNVIKVLKAEIIRLNDKINSLENKDA